jgi:hypothetical protein
MSVLFYLHIFLFFFFFFFLLLLIFDIRQVYSGVLLNFKIRKNKFFFRVF